MSWTLCTSGAAIAKAGANANATIIASGATLAAWYDEAEGNINAETRKNWTSYYTSGGAYFKNAVSDAVSSMIAMKIITYDMSGYTSRSEAQTMLDVNRDIARTAINYLKDVKNQEVM